MGLLSDRFLSQLDFIKRVLYLSERTDFPLMERLRFLSIGAVHLTDFLSGKFGRKMSDDQKVRRKIIFLNKQAEKSFCHIKKELEKEKIFLLSPDEVQDKSKIFPKISVQILPFLSLKKIGEEEIPSKIPCIFLKGRKLNSTEKDESIFFLSLRGLPHFLEISPNTYLSLGGALQLFPQEIESFFNMKITDLSVGCVFREKMTLPPPPYPNLPETIQKRLRKPTRPIAFFHAKMSPCFLHQILQKLPLSVYRQFPVKRHFLFLNLASLIKPDYQKLCFPKETPVFLKENLKQNLALLSLIKKQDVLIHHPYESFELLLEFLNQGIQSPDISHIFITLYRTNDELVSMIEKAHRKGKQVTVFIELRARDNETDNLLIYRRFKQIGIETYTGHPCFKTHAKILLMTGKESFVHFSTGNYHVENAKNYTDLSYFTAKESLCRDGMKFFNFLKHSQTNPNDMPPEFEKIILSPYRLKQTLLRLIDQKTKQKNPYPIILKANSLTDESIISALYKASQSGVDIKLIIRGTCLLKPQIQNISENISVKSIIGRFLEHSRIFCFEGSSLKTTRIFISSADLRSQNTEKRLEIMVPITSLPAKKKILKEILYANLSDQDESWVLHKTYLPPKQGTFNCRKFLTASERLLPLLMPPTQQIYLPVSEPLHRG